MRYTNGLRVKFKILRHARVTVVDFQKHFFGVGSARLSAGLLSAHPLRVCAELRTQIGFSSARSPKKCFWKSTNVIDFKSGGEEIRACRKATRTCCAWLSPTWVLKNVANIAQNIWEDPCGNMRRQGYSECEVGGSTETPLIGLRLVMRRCRSLTWGSLAVDDFEP